MDLSGIYINSSATARVPAIQQMKNAAHNSLRDTDSSGEEEDDDGRRRGGRRDRSVVILLTFWHGQIRLINMPTPLPMKFT